MKNQYKRDLVDYEWSSYGWVENRFYGRYMHQHARYFRYPSTHAERRAVAAVVQDGVPVRASRRKLPTAYDDMAIQRNYGRSWKDYTKKRRQWENR